MQLEELIIRHCGELEHIFNEDDAEYNQTFLKDQLWWPPLFPNLSFIRTSSCNKLKGMFPISIVHLLSRQNLTTLQLYHCHSLTHLFSSTLARNLLQLISIDTMDCGEQEQIIVEDRTEDHFQIGLFQNLSSITVQGCNKLKNLFPIAIARSGLHKLRTLYIQTTFQLEELFGHKEETDLTGDRKVVLPQLHGLTLRELASLVNFYPSGYHFVFPSLPHLQAPQMGKEDIQGIGLFWTGLSVLMPEPPAESVTWVRGAAKVNNLPFLVYESRMDLLRAVIIGAEGTPYHDGLFFFDVFFPSGYPNVPPLVYYHSGGLRINPNLYNCGKVCLSLLNTWSGNKNEKWIPSMSTMLQVLVSIQALILNQKPYFNEPGYASSNGTAHGENSSQRYNENTFILSLKTMVYTVRRPPKYFKEFVVGHFYKCARDIVTACKAYMDGAQVGCLVKGGVQDVDEGDKSSSEGFKNSLRGYVDMLVKEFKQIGVKNCENILALPKRGPRGVKDGEDILGQPKRGTRGVQYMP
ncbi:hypothetical protein QYF36_026882 [Acer negundo]|nr:hypothetical protein QYF36_026882 [Acer negundo]